MQMFLSVREGQKEFGVKAEIKNLNSMRFVQRAIDYEIDRQISTLEAGGKIVQETRLWNERDAKTVSMRSKENAHDYRYFPEPDLPPLEVSGEWIDSVKAELPELPEARRHRFMRDYQLSADESFTLTGQRELADYFEESAKESGNSRAAANWILSELLRALKTSESGVTQCRISAAALGGLIRLIDDGTISGKIAKEVFSEMFESGKQAPDIVREKGLVQITDTTEIEKTIDEVIAANPTELEQYRAGKTKLMGFFVGQVMKLTGGKANPQAVNALLKTKLQQ
jgi:aspartyl-tRNA(Asn)/glutamyl-tRNA(Gln) amidotransferase subunit B